MGARAGEGFSINLPVPAGSGEDAWISLLEHIAVPAALEFRPDLVLISAGYEAHRDDAYGDCELDAGSFAEMTRHLRALGDEVDAPVGVVLEGGYALQALSASVAATMEALAGDEPPEMAAPTSSPAARPRTSGTTGRFESDASAGPGQASAPIFRACDLRSASRCRRASAVERWSAGVRVTPPAPSTGWTSSAPPNSTRSRSGGRRFAPASARAVPLSRRSPAPSRARMAGRAAYRASQRAALAVLSRHESHDDSDEPAEHVTTWWCAECGGIDAPQPCLGICVWRPANWVNRTAYEAARSRAAGERDVERAMVGVLRRVACVTPREGHWERNWRALHADAREALRASASLAALGPASAPDRRTAHADPA